MQEGAGELGVLQRVSASVETKYGNDAPLGYLHTKSPSFYSSVQCDLLPARRLLHHEAFFFLSLSLSVASTTL